MKIIKNENILDRFLRIFIFELLFIGAFFWVSGWIKLFLYIFSALMLITGITGFCGLYKIFKIDTTKFIFSTSKIKIFIAIIAIILTGGLGSYYSNFFTKKFFLEDYNRMNNYYKQALFFTGQDKRTEAKDNYNKLMIEYPIFLHKYTKYHPYVIMNDKKFNADISDVYNQLLSLKEEISNGDLLAVHKKLELVRPIYQDILKRNGFSMLAVVLVDFHDAMEKIISAADVKDSSGLIAVYPEVDLKLQAVEEIANDGEIKTIRQKLNDVYELAKNGKNNELSAKAAELKSSFVKVYMKRG